MLQISAMNFILFLSIPPLSVRISTLLLHALELDQHMPAPRNRGKLSRSSLGLFSETNLAGILVELVDADVPVAAEDPQRRHEINGLRLLGGVDVALAAADFLPVGPGHPRAVRLVDEGELPGVIFGRLLAIEYERHNPPRALVRLPFLCDGVIAGDGNDGAADKSQT